MFTILTNVYEDWFTYMVIAVGYTWSRYWSRILSYWYGLDWTSRPLRL